jgi:glutathione reductase (NADPH)
MSERYDFIVIGGGSGGIATARRAAAHGARVAVVERGQLGGTCVNVGCIPKKILFNAAALADAFEDAAAYGFEVDVRAFDWGALRERRDAYIRRLNGIYAHHLEKSGIEHVRGTARFVGGRTVAVGERRIEAGHVLIATGGRPVVPELPGAELGITSDGFFELPELPEHAVIVGAGYIAVELAGVLAALGARVTLLIRKEELLRGFEAVLRRAVMDQLEKDCVVIQREEHVDRIVSVDGSRLAVHVKSGLITEPADVLIWAVGRVPVTAELGLEQVGVEVSAEGHVEVDAFQNTSAPGIYAVGDVTGRLDLTPVAIAAGRRLADRLFGGEPGARLDYDNVPSVIFSHPPIATVGLTEERAIEVYGAEQVKTYSSSFVNLYYALGDSKPRSHVLLVVVGAEERVVGVHFAGMGADELIQGFAVAVNLGARKADFDRTVAVHPTAAEELVTIR